VVDIKDRAIDVETALDADLVRRIEEIERKVEDIKSKIEPDP
jgi:hypothetical protein